MEDLNKFSIILQFLQYLRLGNLLQWNKNIRTEYGIETHDEYNIQF